ncbi:hypothetical protein PISS_b0234 [Pseudoalteromonas issachenkonii]|uniref:Uncharacterized protein n=1 Tax=Pseudoalteromonas issachenkonii TaxID=152297 RepID=A0ABM6N854_9GAMM|nr:hypothetical protein PISS_b0234 [Pseudoalteromonas issachenkonii]
MLAFFNLLTPIYELKTMFLRLLCVYKHELYFCLSGETFYS